MLRWAGWLVLFTVLFSIPNGPALFLVSLIGPWFYSVDNYERGLYVLAAGGVLLGLGAALLWPMAWMLTAPRKPTALFLRRFRLDRSSNSMTDAIEHGTGRQIRVVTLDDRSFRALEAPPSVRRLTRWAMPSIALGMAALIFAALSLGTNLFQRYTFSLNGMGVAGMLIIAITEVVVGPMILPGALYLIAQLSVLLLLRRRVRRRGTMQVASLNDLERVSARVRTMGGRWRGSSMIEPQATVIEVSDDYWQQTVHAMLRHADYVLVDVSQVTENLLWELEQVLGAESGRAVFTADSELLRSWTDGAAIDPLAGKVSTLLSGIGVIEYQSSKWLDRRRFRTALSRALDNLPVKAGSSPAIQAGLRDGRRIAP